MLTDSGIAIGRVAFSSDGRDFFYSFTRHWFNAQGSGTNLIHFDGRRWLKPRLIAKALTLPTLSIDEKSLYLLGEGNILWKAAKKKSVWEEPHPYLHLPYDLYNFMPVISGNFYIGTNGTWGKLYDYNKYNFSVLSIERNDTLVKSLGMPLNRPGFNGDFYVRPDESYMIISTNESADFESELYISFRKEDETWTPPISLGEKINMGKAHRFGQYVTPDGKYLFYTSGTNEEDTHIYWLRFDNLLEKLRKQAQSGRR